MKTKKPRQRKATSGPVEQVRRLLLLIPAAWKAGPQGLPLERAVKLTGARSASELEERDLGRCVRARPVHARGLPLGQRRGRARRGRPRAAPRHPAVALAP
jgi:hypothetical protein